MWKDMGNTVIVSKKSAWINLWKVSYSNNFQTPDFFLSQTAVKGENNLMTKTLQ